MGTPIKYDSVLHKLWVTWALCYGMVTAFVLAGYWVPHMWLPAVAFVGMAVLIGFSRRNMGNGTPNCTLLVNSTNYTLLISGFMMLALNVLTLNNFKIIDVSFSNPNIPFVSSMIVYPVALVCYGVANLCYGRTDSCKECRARSGYSISAIVECNVFRNESKYLLRNALIISFGLSAVVIAYYCAYYIDENINSPDTFFFFIIPVAIYALSLIYISMRYLNLHFAVTMAPGAEAKRFNTHVRFMVVHLDKIMLHEYVSDGKGIGLWDTPVIVERPFVDAISAAEAAEMFEEKTGIKQFRLKRLFCTSTASQNAFHYVAFLPDDCEGIDKLSGEWFNLLQLDIMLKEGMVTRPFAYELHRVYTMTMAWKTYDREGNRLYPIKNYRPTFRLVDFKDWDLDYSDMHWMDIADNNADRPFFKLRRFWRRHITGSEKKWNRSDL